MLAAGLGVAPAVLAGYIHIEVGVEMVFDGGDTVALLFEQGNQFFDEGGFSTARFADKGEDGDGHGYDFKPSCTICGIFAVFCFFGETFMLVLILLFILGAGAGILLRKRESLAPLVEKLTQLVVCALMVVLGISVGANPQVMQNLGNLGLQALALTVGAVTGSIVVVKGLYRITERKPRP